LCATGLLNSVTGMAYCMIGSYTDPNMIWCWNSFWWWSYVYFCLPVDRHFSSIYFVFHCQYSSSERSI